MQAFHAYRVQMEVQEMTASISATGRQVEVNGASLYVEEQGTGDPILLVQPGLVSSAVYASLVPLLARELPGDHV